MSEIPFQITIGVLTLAPFVLLYWLLLFRARRRIGRALVAPRPLRDSTLRRWVERGWLDPDGAARLPAALSPVQCFYEWAWSDGSLPSAWQFRGAVTPTTSLEDLLSDVWKSIPDPDAARERLAAEVRAAGTWWGGAERGWNRRPLSIPAAAAGRKDRNLPLLPMDDLTAAPAPGPLDVGRMLREAEGPELVLALAALRRAEPVWSHPLAPGAGSTASLVSGVSERVGTDVGRRIGAGLGGVLGPIGSMLGSYLGGMAGAMGGRALLDQAMPATLSTSLRETEAALAALGELASVEELDRAVRAPADAVLSQGRRLEAARASRSRRMRERFWPTAGLVVTEELLKVALKELAGYRAAADRFIAIARKSPPAVAGGMLLQNPWLAARLPEGVERLNAARATLNRTASMLRR